MSVALVHHGDEAHLLYIARVSSDQANPDPGLIGYLMRNGHWSPFEMVGACVEINTTRDIGRQILRHRSFSYQEFSQRYAEVAAVMETRELRLKGTTNRQGSRLAEHSDELDTVEYFKHRVGALSRDASDLYREMLDSGIAPECARAILPEGLTPTRLYMNGTLRSWIHYLRERLHVDPKRGTQVAQREHILLAEGIYDMLSLAFPVTFAACEDSEPHGYIDRWARQRLELRA